MYFKNIFNVFILINLSEHLKRSSFEKLKFKDFLY